MLSRMHRFIFFIALLTCGAIIVAGCAKGSTTALQSAPDGGNSGGNSPSSSIQASQITIQDAYGEVSIPANPGRIVVLDIGALDNLLALGIKPVGAPSVLDPGTPYPAYLSDASGIDNIGSVNEPNLERIDSLKPDLIIGNKDTHDQIHDQLRQIAPTVFVETLGVTWKENLQLHAKAVGKEDAGEKLLADYTRRIEELKEKVAAKPAPVVVSLFRTREDKIQVYLEQTFSGSIMKDAGIQRPESQLAEGFSKDVTEEQLAELDGDVLIWFSREPDSFEKLQKSALWSKLEGVQNQNVHQVDWETWMSGLGMQAVNKVVDDLFRYVGEY
ncbi:iron-siderophore ABC transporter substrate-binding protein [Paenibacillus sp. YSY-4.3]